MQSSSNQTPVNILNVLTSVFLIEYCDKRKIVPNTGEYSLFNLGLLNRFLNKKIILKDMNNKQEIQKALDNLFSISQFFEKESNVAENTIYSKNIEIIRKDLIHARIYLNRHKNKLQKQERKKIPFVNKYSQQQSPEKDSFGESVVRWIERPEVRALLAHDPKAPLPQPKKDPIRTRDFNSTHPQPVPLQTSVPKPTVAVHAAVAPLTRPKWTEPQMAIPLSFVPYPQMIPAYAFMPVGQTPWPSSNFPYPVNLHQKSQVQSNLTKAGFFSAHSAPTGLLQANRPNAPKLGVETLPLHSNHKKGCG